MEILCDDNFLVHAARHYDNPQCFTTEEFLEDLNRFKYIKKLITRYVVDGDLKEKLILNHMMVLRNVFGSEHLARFSWLKMGNQFKYVKPFLIMLNSCPGHVENVGKTGKTDLDSIMMDSGIVEALRKI